jgi:hypothetical protein
MIHLKITGYQAILDSIRRNPDDAARWLALAGWLFDNGRDDEAVAVRVFYPVLVENLERGATVEDTLAIVRRNAGRLARRARLLDERAISQPSPDVKRLLDCQFAARSDKSVIGGLAGWVSLRVRDGDTTRN